MHRLAAVIAVILLAACSHSTKPTAGERFLEPASTTTSARPIATFADVAGALSAGGLKVCSDDDEGTMIDGAYDHHSYELSIGACPQRDYDGLLEVAAYNTKTQLLAAAGALPGGIIQEWAVDNLVVSIYGSSKPAVLDVVRRVMATFPGARETAKKP